MSQLDLGSAILRGWLEGQQSGQRRYIADQELELRRAAEQRYAEQYKFQRQLAERAQQEEMKRRAADSGLISELFAPTQPGQMMGGAFGTPAQGPAQPPDLRAAIARYGGTASPSLVNSAISAHQSQQQIALEDAQRQRDLQRINMALSDVEREIQAREAAIRKAGGNPGDPVAQQAGQQLRVLYSRRNAIEAAVMERMYGTPQGTMMGSLDRATAAPEQDQATINQRISMLRAQYDEPIRRLTNERDFLVDQVSKAMTTLGVSTPEAMQQQTFAGPNGEVISYFSLRKRLAEIEPAIAQLTQQRDTEAAGLVGAQPMQTQGSAPAPPPSSSPIDQIVQQLVAEHPDWSREQIKAEIKRRLGN